MVRKLTITVDEDVYEGLRSRIGPRRISRFLNDLVKPLVTEDALLAGYRDMAADGVREDEDRSGQSSTTCWLSSARSSRRCMRRG